MLFLQLWSGLLSRKHDCHHSSRSVRARSPGSRGAERQLPGLYGTYVFPLLQHSHVAKPVSVLGCLLQQAMAKWFPIGFDDVDEDIVENSMLARHEKGLHGMLMR